MTFPPAGTPRIAIVGAGIAGLAAANRVLELSRERQSPVEVTVFEAATRPGGCIATECTDGFVIESGPDAFLSEKPWALQLCQRLGLARRLVQTREENRRTHVVRNGRLHPLPEGFLLLAPTRLLPFAASGLFSWRGKLRIALDLVLPRGKPRPDESLASFVTRRLGREALERVAQPLVGGIYAADPEDLSLAATMPRFLEMERQHRSVILAMWRAQRRQARAARPESGARWSLFVSLDTGMQSLVEALVARLPEGALQCGRSVVDVRPAGRRWRIATREGGAAEADAVVLATPAYMSAELLRPTDAELARELAAIPYTSSATVTLAYRQADFPRALDGSGFVVPAIEGRPVIACTYSSLKYPGRAPDGYTLLRVFFGGSAGREWLTEDDGALAACAQREIRALLGPDSPPVLVRVKRHPKALPQYRVGHLDRMARIDARRKALPPLALAGSAYRGVGIPDCVRGGEQAAEALLELLAAS